MPTVMGERFPTGMAPGDRIEWGERGKQPPGIPGQYPDATRSGVVIDRAANGVGDGCELPGFWLWVQPDGGGGLMRVRTWASGKRKGEVWRDDGPLWERSNRGAERVVDKGHRYEARAWFAHRGRGACLCCDDQEARTG